MTMDPAKMLAGLPPTYRKWRFVRDHGRRDS